jgi:hypothetical protein
MDGGLPYPSGDEATRLTQRRVDRSQIRPTTITATAGGSSKTIKIIVYQAKFEIDADAGDCATDTGHTCWNLTIQPSDVYPFLKKVDGTDLRPYLGTGGYYCNGGDTCCLEDRCYGYLQQPDAVGVTSCSYWWCISFGNLISALTYVADLKASHQIYQLCNNSCVTQVLRVGAAARISLGINGSCISPCDICSYLDANWYPVPETCQCR